MSIDLGAPALDVVIGLAFVFFLLSLIVTAGVELTSWLSKRRAKTLVKGIEGLMGEEGAAAILKHPLVKTDVTPSGWKKQPSYLSARNFALALTQNLRQGAVEIKKARAQLRAGIEAVPEHSALGIQLRALLEAAEGDVADFRGAAEKWFDDGMDRVSGWYKRWAQVIAIVIALVVTIGLNADAIRITERLANDPALRTLVVEEGIKQVAAGEPASDDVDALPSKSVEAAASSVEELKGLELPFLWSEANDNVTLNTIFGWLVTTIAICLGAPFWFDTLSRLSRLRSTGKRPEAAPPT